jgi:hypothetical protein
MAILGREWLMLTKAVDLLPTSSQRELQRHLTADRFV